MPKLKTIYVFLISSLCLVILSLLILVNQTWFWAGVLKYSLNHNSADIQITELNIVKIDIHWPRSFQLETITFQGQWQKEAVKGSVEVINIYFLSSHQLKYSFKELFLNSSHIVLEKGGSQGKIEWKNQQLKNLQGELIIKRLRYDSFNMTDIEIDLQGDDAKMQLSIERLRFCEGKLAGPITINYNPQVHYDLQLTLNAVNLKNMEENGLTFFAYARGIVDGNVNLKIDENNEIKEFSAQLLTIEQAQMKAAIINFIVQAAGIKEKLFDDRFEVMVKNDEFVPLRKLHAKIINFDQEMLQAQIDIQPRDYNVRINAPIDIHVDEKVLERIFARKETVE